MKKREGAAYYALIALPALAPDGHCWRSKVGPPVGGWHLKNKNLVERAH